MLQQIAARDQIWVERFRRILESRQCELIGSGWSKIIGPLVPYEVNRWNQKLGLGAYRQMLGVTPKFALVNEMAFFDWNGGCVSQGRLRRHRHGSGLWSFFSGLTSVCNSNRSWHNQNLTLW
jgi:hypothetical protein